MSKTITIGVFDSGMGGLAVASKIAQERLATNILYLADTKWLPYGNKTQSQILWRIKENYNRLKRAGATCVVIGCNTASLCVQNSKNADENFAKTTDLIPTLPPFRYALENNYKSILVLATPLSVSILRQNEAFLQNQNRINIVALDNLAFQIEHGENRLRIEKSLRSLLHLYKHADCVILGCTHYIFLENFFRSFFEKATILDGRNQVTCDLRKKLENFVSPSPPTIRFLD